MDSATTEERRLWEAYRADGNADAQQWLVFRYVPWARAVARDVYRRARVPQMDWADYAQNATQFKATHHPPCASTFLLMNHTTATSTRCPSTCSTFSSRAALVGWRGSSARRIFFSSRPSRRARSDLLMPALRMAV